MPRAGPSRSQRQPSQTQTNLRSRSRRRVEDDDDEEEVADQNYEDDEGPEMDADDNTGTVRATYLPTYLPIDPPPASHSTLFFLSHRTT